MKCSICSNSRLRRINRASISQDDEGFRQRLWSVTDAKVLAKVVQIMNTETTVHRRRSSSVRNGSQLPEIQTATGWSRHLTATRTMC